MMWLLVFVILAALIAVDSWIERRCRHADLAHARGPAPQYRYCPLCSAFLVKKEIGGRLRLACPQCPFVHWDNPKPVVVTLVPLDGGLVMVKRKVEPAAGSWALPGGFIEGHERPDKAAAREVLEETGLKVEIDRVLGAYPASPGVNQVILVYLAKPASGVPKAGDDALEARAFTHDEVPYDKIVFKLHKLAVQGYFAERGWL